MLLAGREGVVVRSVISRLSRATPSSSQFEGCRPKQSLLYAVLEGHLNMVSQRAGAACAHARHKPLDEMINKWWRSTWTSR